jgi:hypothetical protein
MSRTQGRSQRPSTVLGRLATTVTEVQHQLDDAYLAELLRWSELNASFADHTAIRTLFDHIAPTHQHVSSYELEVSFVTARHLRGSGQFRVQVLGRTLTGFEAVRTGTRQTSCTVSLRVEAAP